MMSKNVKRAFLAQRSLAVVGISRTKGFGNRAVSELKRKGYQVYPVGHGVKMEGGQKCYDSLNELPQPVDAVLTVVPPEQTEKVVADCIRLGIKFVWMQQGSESPEALRLCQQNGIAVVHNACVLMYADPTGFHRLHRWVYKILGRL